MENKVNDELIIRYLNGTVDCEEKALVEHWCAMDDENQHVLEQYYFTLHVSDCLRIRNSTDSDKALKALKDRIRQKTATSRRRLVVRHLQQVAAILLLPVIMLSTWLLLQKNETQAPVQMVKLHSNPGMVASFILPDGSKVWLNGGSRLCYPVVFDGDKREIQMSGQGYFEIARNDRQPFIVRTGETFSLEVFGTSFNLTAYDDEDIIETTLVEGSVRLNLMQNGRMAQRVMKPNEKVIYNKIAETETVKSDTVATKTVSPVTMKDVKPQSVKFATVDPQYDIAWKDRQILFKNHPMPQVIRTLGRYYNVQFSVKDEKVMESVITGRFSNEQLPQVMEYLKIASCIKYKIIPATVGNEEMTRGIVEIWK